MRRLEGNSREIDCGKTMTIRVDASPASDHAAVPDLQHVQMRHAPAEFTCGPQDSADVIVDYARTPTPQRPGSCVGWSFE